MVKNYSYELRVWARIISIPDGTSGVPLELDYDLFYSEEGAEV